jgi:hypothetical protein
MATEQRDSALAEGADAGPLSAWRTQTTTDQSDAPVVDDNCRVGAAAGLGDAANAPPHLHRADGDAADEDPPPKLPGLESY